MRYPESNTSAFTANIPNWLNLSSHIDIKSCVIDFSCPKPVLYVFSDLRKGFTHIKTLKNIKNLYVSVFGVLKSTFNHAESISHAQKWRYLYFKTL